MHGPRRNLLSLLLGKTNMVSFIDLQICSYIIHNIINKKSGICRPNYMRVYLRIRRLQPREFEDIVATKTKTSWEASSLTQSPSTTPSPSSPVITTRR
jgi:hypothetical protein